MSPSRSVVESRAATDFRSWSPASWPSVSFTCLKPSRSMNSAAVSVPLRRARASICSTRSRMSVRFGRPVSASCSAWWRMPSSRRALRIAIVAWLATPRRRPASSGSSIMRSGRSTTSPTTRPTRSSFTTIGIVATAAAPSSSINSGKHVEVRGALAVPDGDRGVAGARPRNRHLHRTQAHVVAHRVAARSRRPARWSRRVRTARPRRGRSR